MRNADIRLAAAAFGPAPAPAGINARKANGAPDYANDIFFDSQAFTNGSVTPGNAFFRAIAMHEVGHALGLKHSFYEAEHAAAGFVPPDFSNALYTQMSYDDGPLGVQNRVFPVTMQVLDIATLQSIYGTPANSVATQGNDDYVFSVEAPPDGAAAVALKSAYQTQYKTIYDTDGIDTFDASTQSERVKINLEQGALSSIGVDSSGQPMDVNIGIAFGTEIENAKGGSGNDRLEGNDLENQLWGNAGDDTLDGGTAYNQPWDDGKQDILEGGTGNDTYVLHQGQGNVAGVADKIIDHNTASERNKLLVKDAAGIIIGTIDGGIYFKQEGQQVWVDMNGDAATKNSPVTITDNKLKVSVVFGDEAGDFQNGDFGIRLKEQAAAPNVTNPPIVGDKKALDQNLATPDVIDEGYDSFGNLIVGATPDVDATDTLYDSNINLPAAAAVDDKLIAGGGNDTVSTGAGNDVLAGGAGRNILSGGTGEDRYELSLGGFDQIIEDSEAGSGAGGGAESAAGFEILRLPDGVSRDDLLARRNGANLILTDAQAASASCSCGKAAKSPRGRCALRGVRWQSVAKVKFVACRRSTGRSQSRSTRHGGWRIASTNTIGGST